MLTVFGGLAEFERDLIRYRARRRPSADRDARASGRPPNSRRIRSAKRSSAATKAESLGDVGHPFNVSPATISRLTACEGEETQQPAPSQEDAVMAIFKAVIRTQVAPG